MATARVLDVGNCDPDHNVLSRMLNEKFDVEIDRVMFVPEAMEKLRSNGGYDLVLVNRLIFADNSPGIELVRQAKGNETLAATPVMMISNFQEAQDLAVAAGAEPGFGKNSIFDPATAEKLSKYLPAKQ